MLPPDKEVYTFLTNLYAELKQQVKNTGCKQEPQLWIICTPNAKSEISLTIRGDYGRDDLKVEGRAIGELAAEFIRRQQFADRQTTLQLGPPTLEGQV